jgi:hypothetical protein
MNKFGSQNIAKLVLFKHSRETSNAQGAFCKKSVVFFAGTPGAGA